MENLSLSPTFLSPPLPPPVTAAARRKVSFAANTRRFSVSAARSEDGEGKKQLDEWDLMELKFGQLIGEDPKLTAAKIMGRKVNPDASYLEIEKRFHKNKGKMVEVKEVPFDVPEKLGSLIAKNGLNLTKPVPKKGIKVGGGEDSSKLPEIKRPDDSGREKVVSATKSNVPNVILRKPSVYNEKDDEMESSSRLRIKANLTLSMRTEPVKEKFGEMTLLKRPEPLKMDEDYDDENENNLMNGSAYSGLSNGAAKDGEDALSNGQLDAITGYDGMILQKPEAFMYKNTEERMQQLEQTEGSSAPESSVQSMLLGGPKRLDQPVKKMSYTIGEEADTVDSGSFYDDSEDGKQLLWQPLKEIEEIDWKRVEHHFNISERVEVELINCSPTGFVVSCGSLMGFLPYPKLAYKRKFLDFNSWLRRKGLNPSEYRQNLGTIGNEEFPSPSTSFDSSSPAGVKQKVELKLTADMEMEDLLKIYDQEKVQYLSSYLGQRIKVYISLADKASRKLIFSMKATEKERIAEKKRWLMTKLSVGDVVKCRIKKMSYFGIFVEVGGVPALIHQSEVAWDPSLDPATYLKTRQFVEAKVHHLDFTLERIFLSLKEITPDPLNEALECIVGNVTFNGGLETAEADSEWPEVDSLVRALQEIDGIETASKGRFFLSPGLAPTFQVYMASMFENQYKLLARSGNKVQEVIVQTSLGKEEMKSVILKCTSRVDL